MFALFLLSSIILCDDDRLEFTRHIMIMNARYKVDININLLRYIQHSSWMWLNIKQLNTQFTSANKC